MQYERTFRLCMCINVKLYGNLEGRARINYIRNVVYSVVYSGVREGKARK